VVVVVVGKKRPESQSFSSPSLARPKSQTKPDAQLSLQRSEKGRAHPVFWRWGN
jgi:hypothetical protein